MDYVQEIFTHLPMASACRASPAWWPLPVLAIGGVAALAIRYLPGRGRPITAGPFRPHGAPAPAELPGLLLAALATLVFGTVLGPEMAAITLITVWVPALVIVFIPGWSRPKLATPSSWLSRNSRTLLVVGLAALGALGGHHRKTVIGRSGQMPGDTCHACQSELAPSDMGHLVTESFLLGTLSACSLSPPYPGGRARLS